MKIEQEFESSATFADSDENDGRFGRPSVRSEPYSYYSDERSIGRNAGASGSAGSSVYEAKLRAMSHEINEWQCECSSLRNERDYYIRQCQELRDRNTARRDAVENLRKQISELQSAVVNPIPLELGGCFSFDLVKSKPAPILRHAAVQSSVVCTERSVQTELTLLGGRCVAATETDRVPTCVAGCATERLRLSLRFCSLGFEKKSARFYSVGVDATQPPSLPPSPRSRRSPSVSRMEERSRSAMHRAIGVQMERVVIRNAETQCETDLIDLIKVEHRKRVFLEGQFNSVVDFLGWTGIDAYGEWEPLWKLLRRVDGYCERREAFKKERKELLKLHEEDERRLADARREIQELRARGVSKPCG